MWQLYALSAIALACLENITDKRAMNGSVIDTDVATFVREVLFCLLVVPITSLLGYPVTWYCSPGIILVGLLATFMATAYTHVLTRINITTLSVLTCVTPLIFLAIDNAIGHVFTLIQVFAIAGLVIGGIGFALDERLKLDVITLGLLAFLFGCYGGEFYYIQYLNKTEGLSGISFFANAQGWTALFLAIHLTLRHKLPLLLTRDAFVFVKRSALAKSFDVGSSTMVGMALVIATVSQFSSMEIFMPLIMLVIALVAQVVFRVDLGENVERGAIVRKTSMAMVLIISGMFV